MVFLGPDAGEGGGDVLFHAGDLLVVGRTSLIGEEAPPEASSSLLILMRAAASFTDGAEEGRKGRARPAPRVA